MWSPQIIHFGVQKEFRKTANHFFKGLFQLLNKNLRHLPNMDSPEDLPTYRALLSLAHMEPQYIRFTCSKLMQNRPNPQTISPSPGFLATNPTCPSGPNLCTEHWRWRSVSSNSSPTPETFREKRSRNGFCSLNCCDSEVNPVVLGGGWWYFTEKSPGQISSCAEVSGYIYTHCTQYLTQYYYHINYLITAIMKSIYKNNNEKFWPPFSHLFKLPSPIFLSKKVPHLVVNLLFSTWC